MHPFVSVNLAGAMVVKFVQAPAWEHWSSFTQGDENCHVQFICDTFEDMI